MHKKQGYTFGNRKVAIVGVGYVGASIAYALALKDVARVIRLAKPDMANAIRFAGDEFIILLKKSSEDSIKKVIQNIRDELALFNENEGRQYTLSLSIGYTLYDAAKDDSDSFFKKMDDNMYEEKKLKTCGEISLTVGDKNRTVYDKNGTIFFYMLMS